MPTTGRETADIWHRRKQALLEKLRRERGVEFSPGERRGGRIARGPGGTLFLPAARERQRGRWWLGLNERAFLETADVRGVVLLCETTHELFDFWLPADAVRQILPRLSLGPNDERKFNVVRRRDRYWLQMPGGGDVDITARRGDTSWLTTASGPAPSAAETARRDLPSAAVEHAFFARVRKACLEPLDAVSLDEGAVVMVRVTPAVAVPRSAALRRIVAAGGPDTLPVDFAEQHDHYAHGARRR
jgi:hypothetical protein